MQTTSLLKNEFTSMQLTAASSHQVWEHPYSKNRNIVIMWMPKFDL